jgi:hypothetical protein
MIVGRKGKTISPLLVTSPYFPPLPPGEDWGEGIDCFRNPQQYCFKAFQYIQIAEAERADTLSLYKSISSLIMLLTLICVMLATIELNTEFIVMAIEIEDIESNRLLTPELKAKQLAITQNPPEELFRVGLVLTQPSREIEKFRVQRGFHGALTLALSRRERGVASPRARTRH